MNASAFRWLGILTMTAFACSAGGADKRTILDLEYAKVDEHRLLLDLYLPAEDKPPLIVWVHGGAWRSGSKKDVPVAALLDHGFAIASVDYRLSPVAPFPANTHDIKAAIRFLRANAGEYGFDPKRIAIAGASAGGHLAALVGVSNGNKELEGRVGRHLDQTSDVQAIISLYGASNLETILKQSTPHGLSVRVPALQLLLGGQAAEKTELARLASPVRHVDAHDPPLLLMHGDQDPQMPINQSHELEGVYRAAGLEVHFEAIHGATHGGKEFYTPDRIKQMADFLQKSFLR